MEPLFLADFKLVKLAAETNSVNEKCAMGKHSYLQTY